MKPFKILTSLLLMAFTATIVSMLFTGEAWTQLTGWVIAGLFFAGFVKGIVQPGALMPLNRLYDGMVISDTTYAGEAASAFITKAITSNETVEGGHVYVKDGIKKKFTIPRWDADYETFIQDRVDEPTVSAGTMTTDGQVLIPADYMIYFEFNPRDYEAHWFATQLNDTLIDRTLPMTVESTIVQEVLKRHNRYINKAFWNNDTDLTNIYKYYDGYIKKAVTAAQNVVSSPTTLTEANIQAELLKGYKKIPAELRYDASMKFFMSYATFDLYASSQIAQTTKGVDTTQEGVRKFKGRTCVPINDLPDNFYFIAKGMATPESNMWVGMNSTEDASLQLSKKQANSEKWFIKMLMKVDVQIGWNEETVLYKL